MKKLMSVFMLSGLLISSISEAATCTVRRVDRWGSVIARYTGHAPSLPDACTRAEHTCNLEARYGEYCESEDGPNVDPYPREVCDSRTQPAPHFGERYGQCYPSCGHLAGPLAEGKDKSCGHYNMHDAGIAYDVNYCCVR